LRVRTYGIPGQPVVVVHGGPGAAGYLEPLARPLGRRFQVFEPFQRRSGEVPLAVSQHVADLQAVVEDRCSGKKPVVVGHSWGAMLALCHAAAHPLSVAGVVLVGCGTFDPGARAEMEEILAARVPGEIKERMARVLESDGEDDERFLEMGRLLLPYYSCDPDLSLLTFVHGDARGHRETWQDMLRLQEEGVVPAAFSGIEAPVLMLHGAMDPHPGAMIKRSLGRFLSRLEYREWERCGHYPWLEREVKDEFLAALEEWVDRCHRS
jgi:pimeloyl-ACP methyl ester carboxylesterase